MPNYANILKISYEKPYLIISTSNGIYTYNLIIKKKNSSEYEYELSKENVNV